MGPGGLGKAMALASDKARAALFAEIERQVKAVEASGFAENAQAVIVRDLALAFRYAYGGNQPGAVTVEK